MPRRSEPTGKTLQSRGLRSFLVALLLLATALPGSCGGGWEDFEPAGTGCWMKMPLPPRQVNLRPDVLPRVAEKADDQQTWYVQPGGPQGNSEFFFIYFVLSEKAASGRQDALLQDAVPRFIPGATVSDPTPVTVRKCPGIDVEQDGNGHRILTRAVLCGRRLYVLSYAGRSGASADEGRKFLESLRLGDGAVLPVTTPTHWSAWLALLAFAATFVALYARKCLPSGDDPSGVAFAADEQVL